MRRLMTIPKIERGVNNSRALLFIHKKLPCDKLIKYFCLMSLFLASLSKPLIMRMTA